MKTNSKNSSNRRSFLKKSLAAGAFFPLMGYSGQSITNPLKEVKKASKPLKILILGGTSFLGPHQIAYALQRGHSISTFTRGKTEPTIYKELFKKVEQLVGDRVDNLEALKNREWNAVIDNSGRKIQWTKDTAELLKDNVDTYLYTSSTGVYFPYLGSDLTEDTKVALEIPKDTTEEERYEYDFGVMKANSELAAQEIFGKDRTIIVRPTYMIGPADRFDRFIHWPVRLSRGGDVLVPGKETNRVQYIDVRDVAEWMIRLIEDKQAGVYNAVGPASSMGVRTFVIGMHAAFSSPINYVYIDDYEFLKEHNVTYMIPWIMPTGNHYGSARVNNKNSLENGLSLRPLARTIFDTYDWWNSDAVSDERRSKLETGKYSIIPKEAEIIKAWEARK